MPVDRVTSGAVDHESVEAIPGLLGGCRAWNHFSETRSKGHQVDAYDLVWPTITVFGANFCIVEIAPNDIEWTQLDRLYRSVSVLEKREVAFPRPTHRQECGMGQHPLHWDRRLVSVPTRKHDGFPLPPRRSVGVVQHLSEGKRLEHDFLALMRIEHLDVARFDLPGELIESSRGDELRPIEELERANVLSDLTIATTGGAGAQREHHRGDRSSHAAHPFGSSCPEARHPRANSACVTEAGL